MKQLLFSVTAKDFDVQTFRAGGKGGQHQNKTESGVRIIHRASGARGEARDSRDQAANKKAAFERLLATKQWKIWYKTECARRTGQLKRVEEQVERDMDPKNLIVEVQDPESEKWVPEA